LLSFYFGIILTVHIDASWHSSRPLIALASYRSRSDTLIDKSQDENPSSVGVVQFPLSRSHSDVLPATLLCRPDSNLTSVS
jgi:hypothetical protein